MSDVIIVFKEVLADLGTFCERHIETCKTGKSFLNSLGQRAHHGARTAYEYLKSLLDDKSITQPESSSPEKGMHKPTQKQNYLTPT
ncbi:DUF5330 domain-containing protein [Bartonella sp. B41]